MTKAKKADLLLCAAKHWQNETGSSLHSCCMGTDGWFDVVQGVPTVAGVPGWLVWASAALSEVASLGFDVETVE